MMQIGEVYQHLIGGEVIFFAKLATPVESAPQVYVAGYEASDLSRFKCGFGATEAEAAADLFRLIRDPA